MRRLWRPLPAEETPWFPSVADWAGGLARYRAQSGGGSAGPLPARLVAEAEALFADLIGSMDAPVLLHGDLHHFNILADGPECWRAIDPKGLIGEPAYEAGALLRNPLPQVLAAPDPRRLLARRLDLLAGELALNRARLRGWGIAQAVLSACWMLEDHGAGWEPVIAFAEHLAAVGA